MTELQRTQLKIAENHFNRIRGTRLPGWKRHYEVHMWLYLFKALEPS